MAVCRDCYDENLTDPVEFRYGLCIWCLSIHLEHLDEELTDLWYGEACE